jgi:hypothetical protein
VIAAGANFDACGSLRNGGGVSDHAMLRSSSASRDLRRVLGWGLRLSIARRVRIVGKLSDQIATIEQRLSQLKVRQQRQARRERTLLSQRERRDDTRRKILVGACVLTRVERCAMTRDDLLALLDPFLTRPDDRHLFGLGLAAGTPSKGAATTPASGKDAGSASPSVPRSGRSAP